MIMKIILELIHETKHAMIDLPNDVEITNPTECLGWLMPLLGYSTVWPTHLYRHSHHTTTGWSRTVGFGFCQMLVIPPNVAFGVTSTVWFQRSFIFTKPYETRFAFSGWVSLNCRWSFVGILACSLQFTWSYHEAAVDHIHFNPMHPILLGLHQSMPCFSCVGVHPETFADECPVKPGSLGVMVTSVICS